SEAPVSSDAPEASETPAQTGAPQSSTAPADSGAAESSDAPQNSGAPEVISRGPSTSRKIAYITIDDGPSRAVTPAILDVLRDEGVKATFFVLPHANVSDLYRRILEEGHAIGNHTFSHDYKLLYVPDDVDAFRDDVLKMRDYIQSLYGYDMKVFRFPGGTMGRPEPVLAPRRTVLLEFGYKTFDWDISVGDAAADASAKNPDALVSNVLNNLGSRERPILLMHDSAGKSATPEALKRIIETLRDKGYVFDTLENY
ncbi:MAG: polysaccharide deacetylase, partial [Oscillospiraceae bacterium]|nr:polysaccharide deacetylase [Oscillospiraceae bacterium]